MFFSVLTKNLNWEILTKNLVTFKKWDVVKDQKFYGVHWKIQFLGKWWGGEGEILKNLILGELPKKGGLDNLQVCGWYPMYTMVWIFLFLS